VDRECADRAAEEPFCPRHPLGLAAGAAGRAAGAAGRGSWECPGPSRGSTPAATASKDPALRTNRHLGVHVLGAAAYRCVRQGRCAPVRPAAADAAAGTTMGLLLLSPGGHSQASAQQQQHQQQHHQQQQQQQFQSMEQELQQQLQLLVEAPSPSGSASGAVVSTAMELAAQSASGASTATPNLELLDLADLLAMQDTPRSVQQQQQAPPPLPAHQQPGQFLQLLLQDSLTRPAAASAAGGHQQGIAALLANRHQQQQVLEELSLLSHTTVLETNPAVAAGAIMNISSSLHLSAAVGVQQAAAVPADLQLLPGSPVLLPGSPVLLPGPEEDMRQQRVAPAAGMTLLDCIPQMSAILKARMEPLMTLPAQPRQQQQQQQQQGWAVAAASARRSSPPAARAGCRTACCLELIVEPRQMHRRVVVPLCSLLLAGAFIIVASINGGCRCRRVQAAAGTTPTAMSRPVEGSLLQPVNLSALDGGGGSAAASRGRDA